MNGSTVYYQSHTIKQVPVTQSAHAWYEINYSPKIICDTVPLKDNTLLCQLAFVNIYMDKIKVFFTLFLFLAKASSF
jgi:hypothetical protein